MGDEKREGDALLMSVDDDNNDDGVCVRASVCDEITLTFINTLITITVG